MIIVERRKKIHDCFFLGNEADEDFETAVKTAREKESVLRLEVC